MDSRQQTAKAKWLSQISNTFERKDQNCFGGEIAWAFRFALALNCILYPMIVFFVASPMFGRSWTLQDPVVSGWNFIPGVDVIRYELFQNANALWSSLRNLGAPILANEVQAAPLFPLTLGLIWLPEPYYWNALVSLRLLLLAMGAYLVASQILKCERLGAIVFTLVFAYAVVVCRWISHPWQNGLLAGVGMIYFSGLAIEVSSKPWSGRSFFIALGLAVSAYALVTCGFPEAAAMSACLGVLVIGPIFAGLALRNPRAALKFLAVAGFAVVSGAMLASAQVFALMEYVSLAGPSFRDGLGKNQFPSFLVLLDMIERYDLFVSPRAPAMFVQFFGLVPLTLFATGIITRLLRPKGFGVVDAIALSSIAFYIVKCFPVWPAFNDVVGSLPILRQSWFNGYFFPIMLFGVAYFSAKGADFFVSLINASNWRMLFRILLSTSAGILALALVAVPPYEKIARFDIFLMSNGTLVILVLLIVAIYWVKSHWQPRIAVLAFGLAVSGVLVLDQYLQKPVLFIGYGSSEYVKQARQRQLGNFIVREAELNRLSGFDNRESSEAGAYASAGVATIDNGAPAILTQRAQLLRKTLFQSEWAGYLPIKGEIVKDAYRIVGRNIVVETKDSAAATAGTVPWGQFDWAKISFDPLSPGRAFIAARCYPASGPESAADIMKSRDDFRPGHIAVENLSDPELSECRQLRRPAWERVPVEADRGAFVRLGVVQGPAFVTLNDSFYPGWIARDRLSGGALEIRPANINFRSVFLRDARRYEIEFIYRPSWIPISLLMAFISAAAWLGLAAFTFFARRKTADDGKTRNVAPQPS